MYRHRYVAMLILESHEMVNPQYRGAVQLVETVYTRVVRALMRCWALLLPMYFTPKLSTMREKVT